MGMDETEDTQSAERTEAQLAALKARGHLAHPQSKLGRLLTAYAELKARGQTRWTLPDA